MALEADRDGVASGEFTVPSGVPAGTVQVEVLGDQGSFGTGTYTASGTITTEQRRIVNTVVNGQSSRRSSRDRRDPLAQTFTLNEGRHIAGVDLWFKEGGTSRVLVQIRETTAGFPNQNIIAQASVKQSEINLMSYTRVTFRPIWLEAGVEYAIVILTDDATTSLAICELGKYDEIHRRYVTAQAYQVGVLLSSSNASTWTAHQEMDLTFRLLACKFTETNMEINLGNVTATGNTDLLVKSTVERVSSETDVEFSLTDTNGNTNTLSEDMPVSLREEISGDVSFKVKLKGSITHSPVLYQGVQLMLGTQSQTADYVTRAIPAGANTTVRIVYESYTPGNSQVKAYFQQPDSTWTLIPLTEGSHLGDGIEERTHILNNYNQATVRIKLVLEGNVMYRPFVKSLRVTTV